MARFTPEAFWCLYREELTRALQTQPQDICRKIWSPDGNTVWTDSFAIPAADKACEQLGLRANERLLRLDMAGFARRQEDEDYNWDLRVAFEHENQPGSWHDELCKLCHIVADLRVLVAYYRRSEKDKFQETVQNRINLMGRGK